MPDEPPAAGHVAIVGGGITGLATAWYLTNAQSPVTCTVLESSSRWGGKIFTSAEPAPGGGQFIVEHGPDSVLRRKPWAADLMRELGLGDRLVDTLSQPTGTLVAIGPNLHPVPPGMMMLAPTGWRAVAGSSLFSLKAKLRILAEFFIPARKDPSDESLANFVRRRFGDELVDRLAEPMLAGIYNADAERLSILATFPALRRMETEHRSLIRAMRKARRAAGSSRPAPSPFLSLDGGMGELVHALIDQLDCDLRLDSPVTALESVESGWRLRLQDDTILEASAVVLALPAAAGARLLEGSAPASASLLTNLRVAGSGVASLAYRRSEIAHKLDGYGIVMPRGESTVLDGLSWSSSKWPGRAPADHVLMRAFFGGPKTAAALNLADDDLLQRLRVEIQRLLGITAEPVLTTVHRWADGYPQYDVGHTDLVDAIQSALSPGLHVCGSPYRGIGIPDCVHQAQQIAAKITNLDVPANSPTQAIR